MYSYLYTSLMRLKNNTIVNYKQTIPNDNIFALTQKECINNSISSMYLALSLKLHTF